MHAQAFCKHLASLSRDLETMDKGLYSMWGLSFNMWLTKKDTEICVLLIIILYNFIMY